MDPNTGKIMIVGSDASDYEAMEHLRQIESPEDILEAKKVLGDNTEAFIDDKSPQLTKLQKRFIASDAEERRRIKRQQKSKAKKKKRAKNRRNGWQK